MKRPHDEILGVDLFDKVIDVNQSPIGRLVPTLLPIQDCSHRLEIYFPNYQIVNQEDTDLEDFHSMLKVVGVKHVRVMVF